MNGIKQNKIQVTENKFELKQENLFSLYILEDNLKLNFNKIQQFITTQTQQNTHLEQTITKCNESVKQLDKKYTEHLISMQKQISTNLKSEIQSTVNVLLSKKLSSILQKVIQYENKQTQKQTQLNNNLQEMTKKLKYEVTQQNQKYFIKEVARIQKDIDLKISTLTQKNIGHKINSRIKHEKTPREQFHSQNNQNSAQLTQIMNDRFDEARQGEKSFREMSGSSQILQKLSQRVQNLEEYRFELDKKFIDNFSALKASWKDLGSELLDNKKLLNRRFDELNAELSKLKTLAQFSNLPQPKEDTFKRKVMDKFNQFSLLISGLTTKVEFEMINQRNKVILSRHSQDFLSIREELHKNAEYFIFYMNNSNTDDLKQKINHLKSDILKDKKYVDSLIEDLMKQLADRKKAIQQIVKSLGAMQMTNENTEGKLGKIIVNLQKFSDRVKILQDINNLDQQKMKKIHDTLDHQMSFPINEGSLSQLQKMNTNNSQTNRQFKKQIQQLKDQVFLLLSQKNINSISSQDQIIDLRNELKKMNQKIQRLKIQSQEAQLSRKPWMVVSGIEKSKEVYSITNNNSKEKPLQRDSSRKKVSLVGGGSGGFFNNNKSEKNVQPAMSPALEEKFEVYEKYRQKYLSDTLRLPEIFKQKLGSQELYR